MAVHFLPMLVVDPTTGLPLPEVRGEQVTIVAEGTDTPLTLTEDKAGTIPIANPVTVTGQGFTPAFWVQEDVTRAEAVSAIYRSPLWSPTALESAAIAAQAAAQTAAANVTALLAGVGATLAAAEAAAAEAQQIVGDLPVQVEQALTVAQAASAAVANRAPLIHSHTVDDIDAEPADDVELDTRFLTEDGTWAVPPGTGAGAGAFFIRWNEAQSRWETLNEVAIASQADAEDAGLVVGQLVHFLGGEIPPAWASTYPGEALWDRDA